MESLTEDEGFRGAVYDDATGKALGQLPSGGWPTVGYGRNLTLCPLSEEESMYLMKGLIPKLFDELAARRTIFALLTESRQAALLNACYHMGVKNLLEFKKMWAAIARLDYGAASQELLDSAAGRRFPKRYERLALWILRDSTTPTGSSRLSIPNSKLLS